MKSYVVIVEPYSSGALLAERFGRLGIGCIAVHLRPLVGKLAVSFRQQDFEHSIVHDGDIDALERRLAEFPLVAVVPGQEAGVLLADNLADRFRLRANDPALSVARRDKYVMHQVVGRAGLRTIDQIKTSSFEEMSAWLSRRDRWPVVVKPALSGGTDGVRICDTLEEAERAFSQAIEQTNLLGFRNDEMLAQELIGGTEYVVDAVSSGGRHYVVSLAYYRKERGAEGGPIYRQMIFIPADQWELHRALLDYATEVLDALGVKVGPSHTEIFIDEAGPILVESGARLCGAMVPLYLEEVSGPSPLDLAVLSYVDPSAFARAAEEPRSQRGELLVYMLMNQQRGRLVDRPGDAMLRSLPTVRDVIWYAAEGAELIPTRDLLSGLGLVFLIGSTAEAIATDTARISEWESNGALVELAA